MKPRILVVEDDALVARDVAETLEDLGYETRDVVSTGEEAVHSALGDEVDLVLMDIRLGGELDGIDAARQIRSERDIPVVYLTAYADDMTLRKVSRSLPCGHVVKPYDARILRSAIEIALSRHRLERMLREREHWFERLVANSQDIIALLDEEGRIEYESPAVRDVLGYHPEERVGQSALDLLHPEDRETTRQVLARIVQSPGEPAELTVRMRHADGDWRVVNVVGQSFRGPEGQTRIVVSTRDVTRREEAFRRLGESEERYRTLFEDNVAGTFQSKASGEIVAANTAMARMLGYASPEELEGTSAASLYPDQADRSELLEGLREEGRLDNVEIEMERKDGQRIWLLGNAVLRETDGEELITKTVVDISRRKRLEEHLEDMAFQDPLTGLANRRFLEREAEHVLALADRSDRYAGVVYMDLADFKEINDTLGHAAGDAVLAEVARRLEAVSRESDLLARIGGDEFGALLPEVDGPEGAVAVARRLAAALDRPVRVNGRSVPVRAQFGVAVFPDHGQDFQELLAASDQAMYRAKKASRGSVTMFDPTSDVLVAGEDDLERELREGLEGEQFLLHYQPILDVQDDTVTGAEAFARWAHPERGLLNAAEFVPQAEGRDLAESLDRLMVERLIADLERWDRKTLPDWISLNLGLTSLGAPSFRRWLGDLIRDELPPGVRLVLDISERTAIRNPELVGNVLSALEGLPVSLALDDFGTGHGSVAFLEQTPMTLVKVDSSFLRDPEQQGEVGALVRALVGLGHAVGMEVGLEGVERRTQYEAFGRDGPDFLQGYYTGAPVEPGRFRTSSDVEAR